MISGVFLSLQVNEKPCQREQQMEAELELQYQLTSQYPEQDQQPILLPSSYAKKSVVFVMLADTQTAMNTRAGKMFPLNRYFINYISDYKKSQITNSTCFLDPIRISNALCQRMILALKVIQIMKNNSESAQGLINHSEDQIEYLVIEKELSVRQESLRNFSFDAGNKTHRQQAIMFLANYTPFFQNFSLPTLRQSQYLRTKHYKQSVYYGQFQNGKKQGLGIMAYNNGKKYEGHWQNDKKSGIGTQIFPNECIYTGNYQLGKPNGEGVYRWPTGQYYKGRWKDGERHGFGKWQATDGSYYQGQWRLSKPAGFGVYISANGATYQGQFKDSLKHGQGVQKFANCDMYRGSYTNGKPSGIGAYYWANGSYFKGSFLNGLREGKGIWKRGVGNSDKYEGSYKNDRKWGYGEFTWQSGNVYKGEYEADSRNGYGQMYWTNGACYKGHWLDGVQHGSGQIHVPGLGYRKGKFDNNELVELEYENLVQNAFRDAHKNQRANKKATTHSSFYQNQSLSNNSFRSRKKQAVKMNIIPKNSNFQTNFEQNHNFNQAKYEQKLIFEETKKSVNSSNRYRQLKKNTLPQQNVQKSRQINQTKIINNQAFDRTFSRSQNGKNYRTLDSKKEKFNAQADFFQENNIKWQKEKNQQTRKHRSPSRPHPKQRLLHSSFYLYKLRQRVLPETANISKMLQIHSASPFSN